MKSIKFLILAMLCAVAQGAWAQSSTTVTTEDEHGWLNNSYLLTANQ